MKDKHDFIRQIIHTKLDCGKSLVELSTYRNISYWWNLNFQFCMNLIAVIEGVRRESRFEPSRFFKRFKRKTRPLTRLFYDVFNRDLYRKLSGKSNFQYKSKNSKLVIFSTRKKLRNVPHGKSGETKPGDFVFSPIIDKLEENFSLVGIYYLSGFLPIENYREVKRRSSIEYIHQIPLNRYWNIDIWRTERSAQKQFALAWKQIRSDKKLRSLCNYHKKDLHSTVMCLLQDYFLDLLPREVKVCALCQNMIEAENPNMFLSEYEYGPVRKSYSVIAPLTEGIPCIALQHGNIYPTHPGYYYTPEEISRQGSIQSPYCPIPDKTLVYGPHFKHILVDECNYPGEKVEITGAPRYDFLKDARNIYSREDFLKRYNLDKKSKIILWTSQTHGLSLQENIANLKAIISAVKKIENGVLLIKQHPNEGENCDRLIREKLNGSEIEYVIAPKDSDAYGFIAVCDLMITKFSTTGTEAVLLGKPLLILNLSGKSDRMDYVDEGVALGVYKKENLKNTIEGLLRDDSHLAKNREKYIEKYFDGFDGKATETVMRFLLERIC